MKQGIRFMVAGMVTGIMFSGIAVVAFPQPSSAQSEPFVGTWQLNLAKSKFSPGPPPKSQAQEFQAEGLNYKVTITGVDADGKPIRNTLTREFDGSPHSLTGNANPDFDTTMGTRIDAYNLINSRTKAGKLVGTQTLAVSADGKMLTITSMLRDANGHPINDVAVYDKQ